MPNDLERVEFIAAYCQQQGRVDKAWGRRFLRQAGHPAPEALLDRIFPPAPGRADAEEVPRIYQNLPPRYGQFIGREAELARVLEWVGISRWPLASIEGMGGIGKTSLAIEVGHHCLPNEQMADSPSFKAVVWTSARDYVDLDLNLNNVLDSIARVLDYGHLTQLQPEQKQDVVDQLLRRYPTLVIVDNFETVTDLMLVRFLEQIPEPSKALITSRYKQLRRVWDIPLYGLKDEETLALIRRHSHRIGLRVVTGADDDTLQRLAAATGNNPKAVQLALGLIKQKGLPFNTVVDELYQASQVVEEVFDYIFAEAWKLLDAESRQVLLTMPLFVSATSREALSAVSGVKGFAFDQAIERLVEMSLLKASEALDLSEQRYRVHPLTQAFAKHKLGVDQSLNLLPEDDTTPEAEIGELKSNFYRFFAEWSEQKIGSDYWSFVSLPVKKRKAIHHELSNLAIALDWSYENEDWAYTLALAKAVVHPFYGQGQIDEYIKRSEYGLRAAKALALAEDEIWFSIDGLGYIYIHSGNDEKAEAFIFRGMQLAKAHGLLDAIALGEIYLGYTALQTDDLVKAQEHVTVALNYAQDSFFKYRAYRAAGRVARHLHSYEQAATYYRQAKEWAGTKYIDKSDTGLGFANLGLKNYKQAEVHFRKTLDYYSKMDNPHLIAIAKLGLALTYEGQGMWPEAMDLANEAFEVFSHIDTRWALEQVATLIERLNARRQKPAELQKNSH